MIYSFIEILQIRVYNGFLKEKQYINYTLFFFIVSAVYQNRASSWSSGEEINAFHVLGWIKTDNTCLVILFFTFTLQSTNDTKWKKKPFTIEGTYRSALGELWWISAFCCLTSNSRIFRSYWRRPQCWVTKFRPVFGIYGLWAGRDLYCVTPAVTRDLGFFQSRPNDSLHLIAIYDKCGILRTLFNPDPRGNCEL